MNYGEMTTEVMYLVQKKPIEISAMVCVQETVVNTIEGDKVAKIGDYIMKGVNGEQWPVTHDFLVANNTVVGQNEDGSLRLIPIQKDQYAMIAANDFSFTNRGEELHAKRGNVIIRYDEGDYAPVAPDIFQKTYVVLRYAQLGEMITCVDLLDLMDGIKK